MSENHYVKTEQQQRELSKAKSNLDNWLITISTALMAAPALFGETPVVRTITLWCVLLCAYVFLGGGVLAILGGHLVGNARREKWIALTFGIESRRPPFTTQDLLGMPSECLSTVSGWIASATATALAESKKAYDADRPLRRLEQLLAWVAFGSFLVGVALFGVVALARLHPSIAIVGK